MSRKWIPNDPDRIWDFSKIEWIFDHPFSGTFILNAGHAPGEVTEDNKNSTEIVFGRLENGVIALSKLFSF